MQLTQKNLQYKAGSMLPFSENKSPILLILLTKIMDKGHKDATEYLIKYLKVSFKGTFT